jgi:hypothetical protein
MGTRRITITPDLLVDMCKQNTVIHFGRVTGGLPADASVIASGCDSRGDFWIVVASAELSFVTESANGSEMDITITRVDNANTGAQIL